MADIVATSTAAEEETPFPSGTADDTCCFILLDEQEYWYSQELQSCLCNNTNYKNNPISPLDFSQREYLGKFKGDNR